MAKVYVSSTVLDLKKERKAVIHWLLSAGHQPVHSYRASSEKVRESCLEDVDGCDLYVLILGHRYGWQPAKDNPKQLSITHLEFQRAAEIPRIALLRMHVPDVGNSDLLDPQRAHLVRAFDAEVRAAVRPAEFRDRAELIHALSAGFHTEWEKLRLKRAAGQASPSLAGVPKILDTLDDELRRKNRLIDSLQAQVQELRAGWRSAISWRVIRILDALTEGLGRRNRLLNEARAENATLRDELRELREELESAVARTVKAAEEPGATAEAVAAANALELGDTRLAEALLEAQERMSAEGDGKYSRREAAARAREQAALALGHDIGEAEKDYVRAVGYEPEMALELRQGWLPMIQRVLSGKPISRAAY
jgi:hypothetical protein